MIIAIVITITITKATTTLTKTGMDGSSLDIQSFIWIDSVTSHLTVEVVNEALPLSTLRGRSWTGIVISEEAHSSIMVTSFVTNAWRVLCSCIMYVTDRGEDGGHGNTL